MNCSEFGVEAAKLRARKGVATVVLAIVAGLALFGAAPAAAATLQVSTTGTNSGNCVESECLTVAYAVGQANGGDTISIGAGTFTGTFTVAKQLTIEGQGESTVLQAASGNLAVFNAGSDSSELKNLALVGTGAASAIRTDATVSGVKVTDVEVTGFTSYAVAIHNNGVIADWVINGLNSHDNGHGMRVRGQAQNLTITNSHFDDNTSHGFFVAENGGTLDNLSIVDSTFNGNGDKAIYLERGTNVSLEGIEARNTGGGTHASPHAVEFNLKFGATAGPVTVTNSVVDGSVGGGIVLRGGVESPTLAGATITDNDVSNAVVGLGLEHKVDLGNVTVSGNLFENNTVGLANSVETGILVLADNNEFIGNAEADIDGTGVTTILPKVTAPTIAGSGTVGEEITCTPGTASGYPEPAVTTEMLLDGAVIPGAAQSYTPVDGDEGKQVSCRSTAENVGGSDSKLSADVTVVAKPNPPKPLPPKIEPVKQQITVPNDGKVVAMTIKCPEGTCTVNAPKKVKVRIGGKVYFASVKVQQRVGEGKSAKVRLVLPKRARQALKGRKTSTKLKVTVVSTDGTKRTVTQTVKLKGKKRR